MTEIDFKKMMAEDRKRELNEAKQAKEYLLSLIPALKSAGAVSLVAEYNGEGDEGFVESISARNAKNDAVEFEGSDESKIGQAAENILAGLDIDWFNNDGGYGEVTLDVEEGAVSVSHNARFTDAHHSDHKV